MVYTQEINLSTQGMNEIVNITEQVERIVKESGIKSGIVTVSLPGSTGGITTIECEPGLIKDLKEALERIAPMNKRYHHDSAWGDGNGYAHIRSALVGTSVCFPVNERSIVLGTWQQLVFIDFDNRPRSRRLIVQVVGD